PRGRYPIHPHEPPGVRHRGSSEELRPARKARLLEVVRIDQRVGAEPRSVGEDVVLSLAGGVAPDFVRWCPAFLLAAVHLRGGTVPGVHPSTIRAPSRLRLPPPLPVGPVGVVDRLVETLTPLVARGTWGRITRLPELRQKLALGGDAELVVPGLELARRRDVDQGRLGLLELLGGHLAEVALVAHA